MGRSRTVWFILAYPPYTALYVYGKQIYNIPKRNANVDQQLLKVVFTVL